MALFLVERFEPTDDAGLAFTAEAAGRAAAAVYGVTHLFSIGLPGDGACLSLYSAPDAAAVAAANDGLVCDRIVEAIGPPGGLLVVDRRH